MLTRLKITLAVVCVLLLIILRQYAFLSSELSYGICTIAFILTLPSDPVASARLYTLQTQLQQQGIVSIAVFGELAPHGDKHAHLLNMLDQLLWSLELITSHAQPKQCLSITYLVLEDDTSLHPNFLHELSLTLRVLPADWKILHLCIGYLWGRNHRPKNGTFELRPDGMLGETSVKPGERFLSRWPDRFATAGSPVAMALKSKAVALELKSAILAIKAKYLRTSDPDELESARRNAITDVMLAGMAYRSTGHFVTASPQLCWEDDLAGQVG